MYAYMCVFSFKVGAQDMKTAINVPCAYKAEDMNNKRGTFADEVIKAQWERMKKWKKSQPGFYFCCLCHCDLFIDQSVTDKAWHVYSVPE